MSIITTPSLNSKQKREVRKAANGAAPANRTQSAKPVEATKNTNGAATASENANGHIMIPTTTPDSLELLRAEIKRLQTAAKTVQAAEKAAKGPKLPGVQAAAKSRNYYAGVVIAKHGHTNGITKEMVAEVDKLTNEPNERESSFSLRNAWHAVRGYQEAIAEAKKSSTKSN